VGLKRLLLESMPFQFGVSIAGCVVVAALRNIPVTERVLVQFISVEMKMLYPILISVFASLLGFILAAAAVIFAAVSSEKLDILRKSIQHKALWHIFNRTVRVLGIGTILCLLGLILNHTGVVSVIATYSTLFITVLSVLRIASCIWILEQVIGLISGQK
jgi:hypothetical protein